MLGAAAAATLLVGAATAAPSSSSSRQVNDPAAIAAINAQRGLSWTAGRSDFFDGKTLTDARSLMGTHIRPEGLALPIAEHLTEASMVGFDPPAAFDARTNWPDCPTIGTGKYTAAPRRNLISRGVDREIACACSPQPGRLRVLLGVRGGGGPRGPLLHREGHLHPGEVHLHGDLRGGTAKWRITLEKR